LENQSYKIVARPKKESPDLKDERDLAMFAEYERIIKSHGGLAKDIAKSRLYADTAAKFYVTEATARIIIQKMLRKKSEPNRCQFLNL